MSVDVFSITCGALDGVKLAGFKGAEHLNRPFEFDVFFTVPVGTDVRGAVGSRATLTADRDDGRGPMCWQGILAGARLLHETAERALYRASLVPKVWLLGQYVRSFVHTKKKVDAYVADTLKDGGLSGGDFEFKTNGAYPQEEFVCQYRESHLDFVHRWFEREGLYYYFEHPEGAGAAEKMVIADDKAQHGPLLGDGHVRYFPAAGMDGSAGECLRELHADFRLLPASVLVTDYNYANPAAPVEGEKPVMSGGQGKIREYGYRVFTEGEAKRLAQVKAQSIACRELVLSASGTYLGLRAGYTFEVDEGPSDLPAEYLAIEVRHAGVVSGAPSIVMRYTGLDGKETYRVDVTAIPANVQYRAPQSTQWPRIYGFENGTVDGPGESQYAQIDDQGRYLVRFKFDASELPDGSTSTYLRMMQPHGGTTEGFHFPLRKGTEVMVSFQGGDPDRPVIAGVVPNAVQPSNVTNRNHTQNVLQTGAGSYIVLDDQEGQEFVDTFVRSGNTKIHLGYRVPTTVPIPGTKQARDEETILNCSYRVDTDRDAGFEVKGGWWQHVGKDYWLDVEGDAAIQYESKHTLHAKGASTEFYYDTRKTIIDGAYTQEVNAGGTQEVSGGWKHQVSGGNTEVYDRLDTKIAMTWDAISGGPATISSGASITVRSPKILLESPDVTIVGAKVQTKSGWWKGISGPSAEIYTLKESAGIQKFDAAAVSISVSGMKRDLSGTSGAIASSKMDMTGVSVSVTDIKVDIASAKMANEPISLDYSAVMSKIAGILKLG